VKHGLERVLFRLSRSGHREVLNLKGALLFEDGGGIGRRFGNFFRIKTFTDLGG
jgi:hypothetical protein